MTPAFRLYQAARFLTTIGIQMLSVAVGWAVYERTGRVLDLGFVGLAQFLPAFLLSPVTGQVVDRVDRRRILLVCQGMFAIVGALLCIEISLHALYALLFVLGTARAFAAPATSSLLPATVERADLPRAIAYGSTLWQIAAVFGPLAAGGLYALPFGHQGVFATASACFVAALLLTTRLRTTPQQLEKRAVSLETIVAGVRYVWQQRILLGAISLDLFAVLLGGAVSMMPAVAKDILHTGAWGLGLLRAAPAVGAGLVAFALARRPLRRKAGPIMFAAVALFGLFTIVFALSRWLPLSLLALAGLGAADMVSVVIRSSLIQLATPDELRGRVSAVNLVFVGASNELGEFESGLMAAWLGLVPSLVVGGVGTLAVVVIWWTLFPSLRRADALDRPG